MKHLKKSTSRSKTAIFAGAALSLNVALALGVGELDVKSNLNQPLEASLPIFANGGNVQPDNLRIRLASPQAHAAAGLAYPRDLSNAQFRVVKSATGQIRVILNTLRPVREPLVKFLLDINWGDGRMMREVTMLLDPPGYQELPVARPTAVAQNQYTAPSAHASDADVPIFVDVPQDNTQVGMIVRAEPRITERPAAYKTAPAKPRRIVIKNNQYGPVQAGDTLAKIASAAYGGKTDDIKANVQVLYKLNPDAFESGDINLLKKGAILRVPPKDELTVKREEPTPARGVKSKESTSAGIASLPTPADTANDGARLKIEPTDRKQSEIARKAAQTEAAKDDAPAVDAEPASPVAKASTEAPRVVTQKLPQPAAVTPIPPESTGPGNAQSAAVSSEIAQLRQADETILKNLTKTQQDLAATRAEIERLIASLKASQGVQNVAASQAPADSLTAKILQWLPWMLLLPLVPALIYFATRNRRREDESLASLNAPAYNPPSQPRSTDIYAAGATAGAAIGASTFVSEYNKPAPLVETRIDVTEISPPTTQTHLRAAPVQAAQTRAQEDEEFAMLFGDQDITPSASDTQETIRPATGTGGAPDAEATQIIQHDDLPNEPADGSLDIAQEAEIYLAYQQYSLAEKTIRKLLDAGPENDRNKLLQLKLFAETGRIDELQKLSVDLLQRYPDASHGTHQQIQNICERAFTKHTANLAGEFTPKPQPILTDDLSARAEGSAAGTVPLEKPRDFDHLTAETLYSEDISDYLSENTLSDLDAFGTSVMTQPSIDALAEEHLAAETAIRRQGAAEDDFDDFPEDVDFLDDAVDTLVSIEPAGSAGGSQIENFSDEDYDLAQHRLHTVESLEIPFDLEKEIQKHDLDLKRRERDS